MTESTATAPLPIVQLAAAGESCDGEYCEIPAHREQLIMNRRVDDDRI